MSRALKVLGATALGALAWGTLVEPRLFTVRRHTLPLLPSGAHPIRILQLSDLHLAPWQRNKIDWVRRLTELRPDLVVLTGDLMGHLEARGALLHALRPFASAGIPTVFVHGSNDYYGPILKNPVRYLLEPSRLSTRTPDLDNEALTHGLLDLGFVSLNNSAARITVQGVELEIFGVDDPHIRYDDIAAMREARDQLPPVADGAQRPVPIGIVHAPYQAVLTGLLEDGAGLILAGHTHGGQVRVPGIGALTANCDLPVRQARGMSVWYDADRAAYLNVSAGLGGSIYAPVRFACRPEASLITLEPA